MPALVLRKPCAPFARAFAKCSRSSALKFCRAPPWKTFSTLSPHVTTLQSENKKPSRRTHGRREAELSTPWPRSKAALGPQKLPRRKSGGEGAPRRRGGGLRRLSSVQGPAQGFFAELHRGHVVVNGTADHLWGQIREHHRGLKKFTPKGPSPAPAIDSRKRERIQCRLPPGQELLHLPRGAGTTHHRTLLLYPSQSSGLTVATSSMSP